LVSSLPISISLPFSVSSSLAAALVSHLPVN
jgi:hypothetical protein